MVTINVNDGGAVHLHRELRDAVRVPSDVLRVGEGVTEVGGPRVLEPEGELPLYAGVPPRAPRYSATEWLDAFQRTRTANSILAGRLVCARDEGVYDMEAVAEQRGEASGEFDTVWFQIVAERRGGGGGTQVWWPTSYGDTDWNAAVAMGVLIRFAELNGFAPHCDGSD